MMILLRVLLLGGLFGLVWMIWRQIKGSPSTPDVTKVENMQKCAQCEQHVPEHNGVVVEGKFYCKEHAPTDQH